MNVNCLTNKDVPQCHGANFYPHDTLAINERYCAPENPKASFLFNKVTWAVNQELIYDIQDAKYLILYSGLIALGISLVVTLLMWLIPSLIIWVLILASVGALIAFGVYLLIEQYYPGKLNSGINAARVKYLDFLFKNKVLLTTIAIVSIILALLILWLALTRISLIKIAMPLISESFKITIKKSLLVILSFVVIACQIGVFYYAVVLIGKLQTLGNETRDNHKGEPFPQFEKTP